MKNWKTEKDYIFDFADITTLVSIVAVILSIVGINPLATYIFIANCVASLIYTIVKVKRFNLLALNIALLIFNISFLL